MDIQSILFAAWTVLIFLTGFLFGMAVDSIIHERQLKELKKRLLKNEMP